MATGILKREFGLGFGLEQRLGGNEYHRKERTFLVKKSESLRTRITALLLGEGGKGSKGKIVAFSLVLTNNFVGGQGERH